MCWIAVKALLAGMRLNREVTGQQHQQERWRKRSNGFPLLLTSYFTLAVTSLGRDFRLSVSKDFSQMRSNRSSVSIHPPHCIFCVIYKTYLQVNVCIYRNKADTPMYSDYPSLPMADYLSLSIAVFIQSKGVLW